MERLTHPHVTFAFSTCDLDDKQNISQSQSRVRHYLKQI